MNIRSVKARHLCIFSIGCLLAEAASALGPATSEVVFNSVLLEQRQGEWRVSLPKGTQRKFGLQNGDVLITVDGEVANHLGPLALSAFMNNAAARTFPLEVLRHGRSQTLLFSQSDTDAPPPKKLARASPVTRGMVAPEFRLSSMDGKQVDLATFRGHWVLLSFWATWCLPCQAESPVLSKLARTYSSNLKVLAVAVQDQHSAVEAFAKRAKPAYEILESGDLKSTIAVDYGVNTGMGSATVPLSVLIRPDGDVAYVQGGFEDHSALESMVASYMNGS